MPALHRGPLSHLLFTRLIAADSQCGVLPDCQLVHDVIRLTPNDCRSRPKRKIRRYRPY